MKIQKEVLNKLIEFDECNYFSEWFIGDELDESVADYIGEFGVDRRIERFMSKAVSEFGLNNLLLSARCFFKVLEQSQRKRF